MTKVAFIITAALCTALSGPAAGAERGSAPAHADIVDAAALRMNWALAMPSVQGVASGATFQGNMPSMGMGMLMPGNAQLTIRREDETGEPVTAPGAFEVTQAASVLVVRTGGRAEAADGPLALVDGSLLGNAAASIGVAGFVSRVGYQREQAPAALIVVVQYN